MHYMNDLFDSFLIDGEDDSSELDYSTVAIRGQFILDGASTLAEAADLARAYAEYLDSLAEEGYELQNTIQDDRGVASVELS